MAGPPVRAAPGHVGRPRRARGRRPRACGPRGRSRRRWPRRSSAALAGSLLVNGVVATLADHHGPAGPAAISEANAVAAGRRHGQPADRRRRGRRRLRLAARASPRGPGVAAVAAGRVGFSGDALRAAAVATSDRDRGWTGRLPPAYWLAWTSMVATGSVEVCLNLWAGDELRSHAHVSPGVATAALSAIIAGMFLGRLVGVRLLLRLAPPRVLLGALAVSAAGFTMFWLATTAWLAIAGLLVCGLGNALHYPLAVALAVDHSDGQPDLAAARSAYAMGVGFGLAPFALGGSPTRSARTWRSSWSTLLLARRRPWWCGALLRHPVPAAQRRRAIVRPSAIGRSIESTRSSASTWWLKSTIAWSSAVSGRAPARPRARCRPGSGRPAASAAPARPSTSGSWTCRRR